MVKTNCLRFTVVALLVAATLLLRAQEPPGGSAAGSAAAPPHTHLAPHGGFVTDVGQDRHFELVAQPRQFAVYVLDSNVATLPIDGMTASADILIKGKERFSVKLTASGDHFVGDLALDPAGRTTIIVTVKSEGKSMIGRFVHNPASAILSVAP